MREQLAVPRAEFRSYYGRQVLKSPVWNWMIAAYLFSGGLSAGSAMLAAGADLTGRPGLRRVSRLGALDERLGAADIFPARADQWNRDRAGGGGDQLRRRQERASP